MRLLTDEHVSPAVAKQAARRCRSLPIVAMRDWHEGHYLAARDEVVLRAAHEEGLSLVTYDLRTIPLVLRRWAEEGVDHGGVVLVDGASIRQNDVGGLVAALCALFRQQRDLDWTNRVVFLRRA